MINEETKTFASAKVFFKILKHIKLKNIRKINKRLKFQLTNIEIMIFYSQYLTIYKKEWR